MAQRVVSCALIKMVMNRGRLINVMYATETPDWKRYSLSTNIQEAFADAMEKTNVPAGATTAIMTWVTPLCTRRQIWINNPGPSETVHPSQADSYPHFTTVYQDDNGNYITTKHVLP